MRINKHFENLELGWDWGRIASCLGWAGGLALPEQGDVGTQQLLLICRTSEDLVRLFTDYV